MAEKSGVSEQVITLPKSGGDIRGLGEQFTPDLSSGTGNFSVPIHIPPGRNGLQPQLALTYSTGSGNGPFGLGWTLGVPCIARRTEKGLPTYRDEEDMFTLDGVGELVALAGGHYRARFERGFNRIRHVQQGSEDFWVVMTPEGTRNIYGREPDSRVERAADGQRRIFRWYLCEVMDPALNRFVFRYKADQQPDNDPQAPHEVNQVYLKGVYYTDYADDATGTWPDGRRWLYRMWLDYGDEDADWTHAADLVDAALPGSYRDLEASLAPASTTRPDSFSNYRPGFEVRTRRRCWRINVQTLPVGSAQYRTVRSYYLGYEQAPFSALSRLTCLRVIGFKPDAPDRAPEAMPPLTLAYTDFDPRLRRYESISAEEGGLPDHALSDPNYTLIDLSGNGLPDVMSTSRDGYRYWRNEGNGRFSTVALTTADSPAGVMLADAGVQLADMEGNGSADLLVTRGTGAGYYSNRFDGGWSAFHPYDLAPSFDLEDPDVRLVDLDGDGVIDVLATHEYAFLYFRNRGPDGWDDPVVAEREHDLSAFPNVSFSDPDGRVRLADMTGDGLQDIVVVYSRRVEYWANLGRGRWGPRVIMCRSPILEQAPDPARLFLTDVDGDGCADLVYVGGDRVSVWINQSGNGWSEEIIVPGTPTPAPGAVRVADMKGSGTAGVLWTYDFPTPDDRNYKYLDFTGGEKPNLLHRVENNTGLTTSVRYRTSIQDYLRDRRAGKLWRSSLPFPVQVVGEVTYEDAISGVKRTKRYEYHHGAWDGEEREFAGFGRVDEYDGQEVPNQPEASAPSVMRSWFHTGLGVDLADEYFPEAPAGVELLELPCRGAHRALRGRLRRLEVYGLDRAAEASRPYTLTQYRYRVVEVTPPTTSPERKAWFAQVTETTDTHFERGNDPRRERSAFTYDTYGNVTRVEREAEGRAVPTGGELYREFQGRHLRLTTDYLYALRDDPDPATYDPEDEPYYLVRKPIEVTTTGHPDGAAPQLLSKRRHYYDGADFLGLGHPDAPGVPVRRITRGLKAASMTLMLTDAILDEAYGVWRPVVEADLAARGGYFHNSEGYWIQWDRVRYRKDGVLPRYGLVEVMRSPRGEDTALAYDQYLLHPVSVTDPNQFVTRQYLNYDFGQVILRVDANENRSYWRYDSLGRLVSQADAGKVSAPVNDLDPPPVAVEADSPHYPTVRYEHRQDTFTTGGGPISVVRWSREKRRTTGPDDDSDYERTYDYFDGAGQMVQSRVQAEPGGGMAERWAVSGLVTFDHKGHVIRKNKPWFADDSAYGSPPYGEDAPGYLYRYDPLGRQVRVVRPNGAVATLQFGVWQTTAFDENDNAVRAADPGQNERAALFAAAFPVIDASHVDTPTVEHHDGWNRIVGFERSTAAGPHVVCTERTLRDWALSVFDARYGVSLAGPVYRYSYDLGGNELKRDNPTAAGLILCAFDAAGNVIWRLNGTHEISNTYDPVNRPLEVREGPAGARALRGRYTYRTWADRHADAIAGNLYGPAETVEDGSGRVDYRYDYRGRATIERRRIRYIPWRDAGDQFWTAAWTAAVPEDPRNWEFLRPSAIDATLARYDQGFVTRYLYNAAGNLVETVDPDGRRRVADYHVGGREVGMAVLDAAEMYDVTTAHVRQMEYAVNGSLLGYTYRNNVRTTLTYDAVSDRLQDKHAKRHGTQIQHLTYDYDPIGNIVKVTDQLRPPLIYSGQYLANTQTFRYDPEYQLVEATGRQHRAACVYPDRHGAGHPPPDEWPFGSHTATAAAQMPYTHSYVYDAAGNFSRNDDYGARVLYYKADRPDLFAGGTGVGMPGEASGAGNYRYDVSGNLTHSPRHELLSWDYDNRLQFADMGGGGQCRFLYDSARERVLKVVKRNGRWRLVIYLHGFELRLEHRTLIPTVLVSITRRLTVGDGTFVILEEGNDPQKEPELYVHADHVGSARVLTRGDGTFWSQEELFPFGRTCDRRHARNRYRYHSKERDDETELDYYGARYYCSVTGRWIQPDPIGPLDHLNLYVYVHNNPVNLHDPSGYAFSDFVIGLAVGIVIGLAAVAAVVALGITAPAWLAVGLLVVGVASVGYTLYRSYRREDWWGRPISAEQADFQAGQGIGGLIGGALGGIASALGGATGGGLGPVFASASGGTGTSLVAASGLGVEVAGAAGVGGAATDICGGLNVCATASSSGGGSKLSTRYGKPHTKANPPHNEAIEDDLAAREQAKHTGLRKNLRQVDAEGEPVNDGTRFRRPDGSSVRPDGVRVNTNRVSNPKGLAREIEAFESKVRADPDAINELRSIDGKILYRVYVPAGVKYP